MHLLDVDLTVPEGLAGAHRTAGWFSSYPMGALQERAGAS
jgi:hypothetical protein